MESWSEIEMTKSNLLNSLNAIIAMAIDSGIHSGALPKGFELDKRADKKLKSLIVAIGLDNALSKESLLSLCMGFCAGYSCGMSLKGIKT